LFTLPKTIVRNTIGADAFNGALGFAFGFWELFGEELLQLLKPVVTNWYAWGLLRRRDHRSFLPVMASLRY
jgi:hypothetical protein